jgi:hypothetical protein
MNLIYDIETIIIITKTQDISTIIMNNTNVKNCNNINNNNNK